MPTRPRDAGIRSSGMSSPTIRSASSAPSRKVSAGPVDLDQRVADRLAGLERDQPAQLLAPFLDAGTDLAQDRAALVGGQLRVTSNALTRPRRPPRTARASRCRSRRRAGRPWPDWRPREGRANRPSGRRERSDADVVTVRRIVHLPHSRWLDPAPPSAGTLRDAMTDDSDFRRKLRIGDKTVRLADIDPAMDGGWIRTRPSQQRPSTSNA